MYTHGLLNLYLDNNLFLNNKFLLLFVKYASSMEYLRPIKQLFLNKIRKNVESMIEPLYKLLKRFLYGDLNVNNKK